LRNLLTILALFAFTVAFSQQMHRLQGYVVDQNSNPINGAVIRVQNTGGGTVTNAKGQYQLLLPEGLNRIHFTFIGYETKTIEQVITKNTVLNISLSLQDEEIEAVEVSNKRRDYSYEILKKVIANKDQYQNQFETQKCKIYIKSVEDNQITKAKKKKKKEDEDPFRNDSIPKLNLFEGDFIQHKAAPNKIKEEKLAAKKLGNQRSLFLTTTTTTDFNFLDNLIVIRDLGDNSYVSPISSTATLAYKFKLLGSRYENNLKVYTISVTPRKAGNALFKGKIEVWDSLFVLKSVDLKVSKNSLVIYDRFSINQHYQFTQGKWVLASQNFKWEIKYGQQLSKGSCIAKYSDYVFDSTYTKRYFNAEIGVTKDDAYDKDTTFWAQIRPVPLTSKERTFIEYQDSILRIKTSKHYLDSIDSIANRITPLKLLWSGYGYINREKKVNWEFNPVVSLIDPLAIGGWRIRYQFSYFKKFDSTRRTVSLAPFLNYGFRNQDIKGNFNMSYKYNPIKQSRISLNTGRYFGFVNSFATFSDIFRRSNFYDQTHLYLYHSTELFNGFYITNGAQYLQRKDLGNFKFSPKGDSLFADNNPTIFDEHNAFEGVIGISFTPKQLYIKEPKEKIVIGSKFPTFSLLYKQAFQGVGNSSTKYKSLDFSVRQLFNIGIMGTSEYSITYGTFLDTTNLKVMDYRYQRGGDPYFFLPSMYGYQLIDSSFATFTGFLETHYVHQFNGFITSKIPGLKQLGIKTMGGGGFLYVPERNYQYGELYSGVNRIFKIGKERLRLGVYYVVSQSNHQGFRNGFKFSIEPYNQDKNTWSF
jgi:hypothetical protein